MDHDNPMTPGEMKAIRAAQQPPWSQHRLSIYLGCTTSTVARWELGMHKIPTPVAKLLRLMNNR